MKRVASKRKLLASLVLAGVCAVMGNRLQAAPNIAGEWKLNPAKSAYGKFPAPQSMVRKITVDGINLTIATVQKGAQGDLQPEMTVKVSLIIISTV